jgi:transcriptional regulator with PAS, ATPase and Fis domain
MIDIFLLPSDSVQTAIHKFLENDCNMIPVVGEERELLGVLSRNSLSQIVVNGISFEQKIGEYTDHISLLAPFEQSFMSISKQVNELNIETLIILDHKKRVKGCLKIIDVIKALEKEILFKSQLGNCIQSYYVGALFNYKEQLTILVNEDFLQFIQKSYSPIDESLLLSASPQITVALNLIQRTSNGKGNKILQLESKSITKEFVDTENDLLSLEDVKETKIIKRWQNMLDTLIEQLYDGVIMVNEFGKVIFLNHKIPDLFNIDNELVLGKHIKEVFPYLGLDSVVETGVADLSKVIHCNGVLCIVQNIPVFEDGNIVGAIGKVLYHGINEARENMIKFDLTNKMDEILEKIRRFDRINKLNHYYVDKKNHINYAGVTFEQIFSADKGMKITIRNALRAAKGRSTILLRGESGTGKELFAQAIHNASDRKDRPFISVNCAAIPEHLLESEFFGYDPGSFTGADKKGKIGKFDLANGGTLFLDEIGDMAPSLQAKLLRVIQDKGFYRIGGTKQIDADVRIIAATHRNLEEMIQSGTFREDLFYRLNVITLDIPPLRARHGDILLLTRKFIEELNPLLSTSIIGIESNAEELLKNYKWPGNIREMKNVIERTMIFAENRKISVKDLPDYIKRESHRKLESQSHEGPHLNVKTAIFTDQENIKLENARQLTEQEMIRMALQETLGNKTKAAKMLGISRSVLYEKLDKYQMKSL